MKAVSLMGIENAVITHLPLPQRTDGELLLRVEMVGLCGTDLNSFRGKNPLITYPRVLGHEIAATVVEGSENTPPGTHVTVSPYTHCGQCASCLRRRFNACRNNQTFGVQRDGALTEFLCVPEQKVYASPLRFKDLCLVEPLTVGFHAVERARVDSTDVVAVFGCGGIGLGAIAGAAYRGAITIAIDVDDAKLAIARAAGATDVIHSKRENVRERLSELSDGNGPDVVIEAIGLPETFRVSVEVAAFTGRVVYIGYANEPVTFETKLFVQKELDILGSRNALPEDFYAVMKMLEEGRFPVDSTVTAIVALEDAPRMLKEWSASPGSFTKIMVELKH